MDRTPFFSSSSPGAVLIGPNGRTELESKEVTIGREPSSTLVIHDSRVSRKHAVVRPQGKSHTVTDIGSANGTFVNGQRLEANIPYTLNDGDTIRIDSARFTYILLNHDEDTHQTTLPHPSWRENTGAMLSPPVIGSMASTPIYSPSPTGAVPPPSLFRRVVIVLFVAILIVGGLYSIVKVTGGSSSSTITQKNVNIPANTLSGFLLFSCQMILLTAVICLLPTLIYWLTKRKWRIVRIIIESLAFVLLFQIFGFWLFGISALGVWIIYAAALIILIEAGSHVVQWRKDTTLKRLHDGKSFKSIEGDAEAIEKMARYEVALYIPVPLGLIVGMIIGLLRHQPTLQIVEFCFQLVISFVALVLLYFLCVGFKRMCEPLFKTIPVSLPEVGNKKGKRNTPTLTSKQEEELNQKYIDLVCDVSELRKVYKYDALHNTILLVALVAVVVRFTFVAVDMKWVVFGLLLLTLVFSEIPYGIGQYLLHQRALERYTGGKHAEMAKKFQELAPTFPPWEFLGALMTTGTAGAILYVLFNQFIQQVLLTIIK